MAYSVKVGSVTLGMDVLLDVKVHLAHAMVGETLESDTLTLTYREKDRDPPDWFVTSDTDEVMLTADGEEKTQKEIADKLGISQSYISRLEKRIISRLKKEILRLS